MPGLSLYFFSMNSNFFIYLCNILNFYIKLYLVVSESDYNDQLLEFIILFCVVNLPFLH